MYYSLVLIHHFAYDLRDIKRAVAIGSSMQIINGKAQNLAVWPGICKGVSGSGCGSV